MPHGGRVRATYDLTLVPGEDAAAKAADVAREQTVEMPAGTPPPAVEGRILGLVEDLRPLPEGRHRAVISYGTALLDAGWPQLLNLVYGNVSMKRGVRLVALDLPSEVLRRLGGPRYGIAGLRELTGVRERPILCTALKPVGLSAQDLADLAYRFARGGMDLVKDDHSLADQRAAPFPERVARCQEAVARANRETGGRALYFPHASGSLDGLATRLELARTEGVKGVLLSPMPQGLESVRLAAAHELVVLAHPTLTG